MFHVKHSLKLTASHARGRFYLRHYFSERLSMDYYYITYHIDIESLHHDRLLELLNSCRLDIITEHKQLADIYYSIENNVLFQHCTTVDNRSLKKPFPMLHLNDDGFGKAILADITYKLLEDWDVFRNDSLCAIEIKQDIAQELSGMIDAIDTKYKNLLNTDGPKWLYGLYTNRDKAITECHQLFNDGYDSEITITAPNKPFVQY